MSAGRSLELTLGRTVPGWAVRLAVPLAAVAGEALVAPTHLPGRVRLVWFAASAVLVARTPAASHRGGTRRRGRASSWLVHMCRRASK